jgi:hypothetical protein
MQNILDKSVYVRVNYGNFNRTQLNNYSTLSETAGGVQSICIVRKMFIFFKLFEHELFEAINTDIIIPLLRPFWLLQENLSAAYKLVCNQ